MSREATIEKVKAAIADVETPAELRAELEGALKVIEAPAAPNGAAPAPTGFNAGAAVARNRYDHVLKKDGQR
jgi:hypothetical protein